MKAATATAVAGRTINRVMLSHFSADEESRGGIIAPVVMLRRECICRRRASSQYSNQSRHCRRSAYADQGQRDMTPPIRGHPIGQQQAESGPKHRTRSNDESKCREIKHNFLHSDLTTTTQLGSGTSMNGFWCSSASVPISSTQVSCHVSRHTGGFRLDGTGSEQSTVFDAASRRDHTVAVHIEGTPVGQWGAS